MCLSNIVNCEFQIPTDLLSRGSFPFFPYHMQFLQLNEYFLSTTPKYQWILNIHLFYHFIQTQSYLIINMLTNRIIECTFNNFFLFFLVIIVCANYFQFSHSNFLLYSAESVQSIVFDFIFTWKIKSIFIIYVTR